MAGGSTRDGTMPGVKSRTANGTFACRLAALTRPGGRTTDHNIRAGAQVERRRVHRLDVRVERQIEHGLTQLRGVGALRVAHELLERDRHPLGYDLQRNVERFAQRTVVFAVNRREHQDGLRGRSCGGGQRAQ